MTDTVKAMYEWCRERGLYAVNIRRGGKRTTKGGLFAEKGDFTDTVHGHYYYVKFDVHRVDLGDLRMALCEFIYAHRELMERGDAISFKPYEVLTVHTK